MHAIAINRRKLTSIGIRRTWWTALLALLFMGVGIAEAGPRSRTAPWKELTSLATVLTSVGKAWVIDKLDETVATTADYVGWGTGAGTAAVGDTTLFTEASEARVSATRTQQTTTVTGDTIQWVATITADGSKTITNAGNFTALTSGTLIVKGDFTGVAVVLNDSIEFTIKLQAT